MPIDVNNGTKSSATVKPENNFENNAIVNTPNTGIDVVQNEMTDNADTSIDVIQDEMTDNANSATAGMFTFSA